MIFGFFVRMVPVPAMVVLGFWVVLQFVNGLFTFARGGTEGVAFLAHVGGFVAGLGPHRPLPAPAGPPAATMGVTPGAAGPIAVARRTGRLPGGGRRGL